ncbi:hypothetical protein ACWPKO_16385 [Coraliomargarita sp. W4R53]
MLEDVSLCADPDGDGITNIEEYARDPDPNNPTQPIALDISHDTAASGSAILSFDVSADVTEVTSVVEYSKDLEDWFTDGSS